jgi:hypothetical protein
MKKLMMLVGAALLLFAGCSTNRENMGGATINDAQPSTPGLINPIPAN